MDDGEFLKCVLLVSPAIRFPPVLKDCTILYVTMRSHPAAGFFLEDGILLHTQEVWTSGERRGICGLGQPLGGQAVLVVLDDDETASNRITSSVTHQGIQEFPHETLLCHMSQREAVKYNYRPLLAWPPGIITMTGLHQLEQLGFVKLNARSTNPLRDADYSIEDLYKFPPHTTQLGHCVARFILTGAAKTRAEARLLVAAINTNSMAIKVNLIAVIAMRQTGESTLVVPQAGSYPPLEDCMQLCSQHRCKLERQGLIWLALGIWTQVERETMPGCPNNIRIGGLSVSKRRAGALLQVLKRLHKAIDDDAESIPPYLFQHPLTEEDGIEIETSMMEAWLHNLVVLPTHTNEVLTSFNDFYSTVPFSHPARTTDWPTEVRSRPGLCVAIHFGLYTRKEDGRILRSGDVTVMSVTALNKALDRLFPGETDIDSVLASRFRFGISR